MNTVGEFFDKVFLNEYHNIRVKSSDTDTILYEFDNISDMERYGVANETIKDFATDWNNRIYILWI